MGALVAVVAVVVVCASWVTWTAGRLDRLHARLDAAEAALDAQLVRRAVAAEALPRTVAGARTSELRITARATREAPSNEREAAENDLSRLLRSLDLDPASPLLAELLAAASRVGLARQFYNDAVRDTRALRYAPLPRLLHLAGHRAMPAYFEIGGTGLVDEPAVRGEPAVAAPTMGTVPPSEKGQ